MQLSRRKLRRLVRFGFPLCGWLSVALYLLVMSGLPIPIPSLGTFGFGAADASSPFLCMHSRCGCQTAEQCWRSCCCHTRSQQLAWAKANNITPPDFVLDELADQRALELQLSRQEPTTEQSCCSLAVATPATPKTCCSTQIPVKLAEKTTCCSSMGSVSDRACGADSTCDTTGPLAAETQPSSSTVPASGKSSVVLLQAMKCQGISDTWTGVSISIPPVSTTWAFQWAQLPDLLPTTGCKVPSVVFSPPVPPPRACFA